MEATVMLADWADAINGKLYIQGGGWTRVDSSLGPIRFALAIKLGVPWDAANTQHTLVISLVDADGHLVEPGPGAAPIKIEANFEVGRPPGLAPGTELDVTLAPNFVGIPLAVGRYRFTLEVDGQLLGAGATFDVV